MPHNRTRIYAAASLLTLAASLTAVTEAARSLIITASPDIRVVVPLSSDPMQKASLTESGKFILYATVPKLDGSGQPITDSYGYPVIEQKIYFQTPAPDMKEIVVSDTESVSLPSSGLNVRPDFDNGRILLRGVDRRIDVEIFSIDGKRIDRLSADSDTEIDLSCHGKGLYVVNIAGMDFKFLVK